MVPTSGGIIGVGMANTPAYMGSDQQRYQVTIPIDYRWASGAFVNKSGLGVNASSNPTIQFGPLLNVGLERKENLDFALQGMGDIQANAEYGGFVRAKLTEAWEVNMALMSGAGTDHTGSVIRLETEYKTGLAPKLDLILNLSATYANEAYMNTYFGVNGQQATNSGYNSFQLAGGLRDVTAGVNFSFQFAPRWFALGGASVSALPDAVKKSPIVRKGEGTTGYLGLAYAF